jgi:membrane-bound lytic murein transglycosylase C
MVARNRAKCSYIVLLAFLALLAPTVDTGAQQQNTRQERGQDVDEDRWTEGSERLNRLKFDREGNWRATEQQDASESEPVDRKPPSIERLRQKGEKRHRAERTAWKERTKEIRKQWGSVKESSPTVYVEYTKNNDAFAGIDFGRGFLEVGAIAPVFFQDAPVRIERLLSERLSFLLRGQSLPGVRDLEGQIRMPGTGRMITQAEVQEFSRYMVRSGEPPHSYTAPDGVRRMRKQIKLEFVPDHLQARVRQYLPYVQKAARIYEVAPELILAVIQTESVFNPRAVSHAGAVGLMQLVPHSGGLEASKLVYGEPRLLTQEEISRPDQNIELGAAYLRILLRRHFSEYRTEPRKLLFLVIASYNCGPRRVKTALGEQDIRSLSSAELYDLLLRVVPRETQVYLQRVVQNMKQYRSITGRNPSMRFVIADFSGPSLVHLLL